MPSPGLKLKLISATLITIGAIAATVHFPWVFTSRRNIRQVVGELHQQSFLSAQHDVAEVLDNTTAVQHMIDSSLKSGLVNLDSPAAQSQLYLNLLSGYDSIAAIKIGFANGDFLGVQRLSNDRYRVERYQWDGTLGEQGAPNSDLANRQTQRRQQAAVFEAAQTWPEAERPTHITQTVVFNNADNTWQVISETEDQGNIYAPLQPDYKA